MNQKFKNSITDEKKSYVFRAGLGNNTDTISLRSDFSNGHKSPNKLILNHGS